MDLKHENLNDLDSDSTFDIDIHGAYKWTHEWDILLKEAVEKYRDKIDSGIEWSTTRNILICGMGGSAIAGDLAIAALKDSLDIPAQVHRGYDLPVWVNENALVICISYSGNTEETISAYRNGLKCGSKIVAISSGGMLREFSSRDGVRHIQLTDKIPAPRLALPHLFVALFSVIIRATSEVENYVTDLEESVKILGNRKIGFDRDVPIEQNDAKKLAIDFHRVFPVFIGTELTYPVALRFQAQLNENSKWPCHMGFLPEMNHNEIVAFSRSGPLTDSLGLLFLADADDHPRNLIRREYCEELLKEKVSWIRTLEGEGKSRLARLMSMVQVADYSTYYLACARGIDPMDIEVIESLKRKLKESPGI